MFYKIKSDKFWNAIKSLRKPIQLFYFDESSNDVISLFNRKYQMDYVPRNISGADINFGVLVNYQNFQEKLFFQLLYRVLQFNVSFEYYQTGNNLLYTTVKSKENLVMAAFVARSPLDTSLLPILKHHSLVWMNNLEYKKSPLYFIETFTASLWSTFVLFFIGLSLAIWMCQKIVNKFKFMYFNLVSLILSQPMTSNETNNGLTTKFILFVFGLLLVLFYSAYSAFIDALLAIQKIDIPFDDLAELYKNPDFVICAKLAGAPTEMIKSLKLADPLNVVQLNTNACPITNQGNGIWNPDDNYKCDSQKVVFISGAHTSNYMKIAIPHCKLLPLPKKYFDLYSSITVSKSFQYREQFNFVLLQIYSSGISFYLTDILPDKMAQQQTKLTYIMSEIMQLAEPISFQQVYLIFMILVIGAMLGFIVLVLEMVWFKKKQ